MNICKKSIKTYIKRKFEEAKLEKSKYICIYVKVRHKFYRELIICGDFGTGGFYFRGMDGYLLSSGFYHPCGLFLPVCALVLCLWFQSFHLCLTFTYIHIYFDFSNFASSNFLFIYVFIDFLHIFTCFFLHIWTFVLYLYILIYFVIIYIGYVP